MPFRYSCTILFVLLFTVGLYILLFYLYATNYASALNACRSINIDLYSHAKREITLAVLTLTLLLTS